MPSVGFEPAVAAIEEPQTYTLDRTTTGIGNVPVSFVIFVCLHMTAPELRNLTVIRCDVGGFYFSVCRYFGFGSNGATATGTLKQTWRVLFRPQVFSKRGERLFNVIDGKVCSKKGRGVYRQLPPPAAVFTHVVFVYRTVWTELAAWQCLARDWSGVLIENCDHRGTAIPMVET